MTVQELIESSLRTIGALAKGETLESEDANDGLEALNMMVSTLSLDRNIIFARTEESFTLTVGEKAYSIGTNTTRPIKIEAAWIEDSEGYDKMLRIRTADEYNDISDKELQSEPDYLYYDPQNPLGHIYLYPVPDEADILHTDSWKPMSSFASLTTTVSFPPGYEEMFKYNLARRLAPDYNRQLPPDVRELAEETLAAVKNVNVEIPTMKTDAPQNLNIVNNIYTDNQ